MHFTSKQHDNDYEQNSDSNSLPDTLPFTTDSFTPKRPSPVQQVMVTLFSGLLQILLKLHLWTYRTFSHFYCYHAPHVPHQAHNKEQPLIKPSQITPSWALHAAHKQKPNTIFNHNYISAQSFPGIAEHYYIPEMNVHWQRTWTFLAYMCSILLPMIKLSLCPTSDVVNSYWRTTISLNSN